MRIYLAARYSRREEMRIIAAELETMGHEVTSRWINGSHELTDHPAYEDRTRLACEDMQDLYRADVVISFTEQPRAALDNPGRGGRHVEFGLALRNPGQRKIVVGWRENVFHYLPEVEFYETWEQAKKALKDQGGFEPRPPP